MKLQTIEHVPSWTLSNDTVSLALTKVGGHLAPVTFQLGKQTIQPFHIAPWADEDLRKLDIPPLLKILRGDFFCLPFGGNQNPWKGEAHPVHGETANGSWKLESSGTTEDVSFLNLTLETKIRPGVVRKQISLRKGQPVVYSRHILEGMSGPMSPGHHAMLHFPKGDGSGLLSFSKFVRGQVYPMEFESPAEGGYSCLKPGARFSSLRAVPKLDGSKTDLSAYPAREGFEDIVMLSSDPSTDFAWSAVTFPEVGYGWFALKDPSTLASTVLWHSNGGRHYPPWNGRHRRVLGIEEVTSFFATGLAESAKPNEVTKDGIPTHLVLKKDRPTTINYIMGCFPIRKDFGRVKSIQITKDGVLIRSSGTGSVSVPVDTGFLYETK